MDPFEITSQDRDDSGWTYEIDVSSSDFIDDNATITVRLDEDTFDRLITDSGVGPDAVT